MPNLRQTVQCLLLAALLTLVLAPALASATAGSDPAVACTVPD
ncbi:hypothetical protein BH11ARM2_BH11ARM2_34060 [soil metagenome]